MSRGPIIVGDRVVDASKCPHNTDEQHTCIHDGRIVWGNVEKTGDRNSDAV